MEPRAYTESEVRWLLCRHAKALAAYWDQVPNRTQLERIEGALFSLFAVLDGSAVDLPAFSVKPDPHPNDKAFYEERGRNWFPDDVDISGSMHEVFAQL